MRKVAWKASSASWAWPRTRRHTPSTMGPWRRTRAAKEASSWQRANRSSNSRSVGSGAGAWERGEISAAPCPCVLPVIVCLLLEIALYPPYLPETTFANEQFRKQGRGIAPGRGGRAPRSLSSGGYLYLLTAPPGRGK